MRIVPVVCLRLVEKELKVPLDFFKFTLISDFEFAVQNCPLMK